MGYALSEAALRRGARVLLVRADFAETTIAAEIDKVESAKQMLDAVLRLLPESSIVIKTAAVADTRSPIPQRKTQTGRQHEFGYSTPAPDILAEISRHKKSQLIIGFAAETENVIENARKKLRSKSLDAIVVNDVSREGVGFDSTAMP